MPAFPCKLTHRHTHTDTHAQTYPQTPIPTDRQMHIHTDIGTHTHRHSHPQTHTYKHRHIYTHTQTPTHTDTHIYTQTHTYIHTQAHRHIHTHTSFICLELACTLSTAMYLPPKDTHGRNLDFRFPSIIKFKKTYSQDSGRMQLCIIYIYIKHGLIH